MKLNVFYNAYGKRLFMGILAAENRRIFFQYTPEFIAEGIDVSPFKLPLKNKAGKLFPIIAMTAGIPAAI